MAPHSSVSSDSSGADRSDTDDDSGSGGGLFDGEDLDALESEALAQSQTSKPKHEYSDDDFDDKEAELIFSQLPERKDELKRVRFGADCEDGGPLHLGDGDLAKPELEFDDDEAELILSQVQEDEYDDKHIESEENAADNSLLQGDSDLVKLARRALKNNFGFDTFRHEQEAAIVSVLAGNNTLVIFPTGGGKSLCYQIPALAFTELDQGRKTKRNGSGITIVVSPLIALMKDQVDGLKSRNISADCIDSTKSWEQVQHIYNSIHNGSLDILYCAPERLSNEKFIEILKCVHGGIRLLAVDEAHCVSEWGHSFRPEYLKVARFAQELGAERVICLTATATPKVADDICNSFKVKRSCVFRTSTYRPNLRLHVEAVPDKQHKYEPIFEFLNEHPGPTLVYVALQEQARLLAEDLRDQGFMALPFHAGMNAEDKQRTQNMFMTSRVRIVCATIAFGMGIDKADIRNIIHFDLPATVEEYSQQIGRAGRDSLVSNCMLYLSPEDFYIRETFAYGDLPSRQSVKGILNNIFHECIIDGMPGEVFEVSHYRQQREFDIRQSPLSTLYTALELRFKLIRAITPKYSQHWFEATPGYYEHMKVDKSRQADAIFSSAVKKGGWHDIDLNVVSKAWGLNRIDLGRKLDKFDEKGYIVLKANGIEHRYRVLQQITWTEEEIEDLADKIYTDLEARQEESLRRVRQVIALITGRECFAYSLAQHFGMGLPGGKTSCGHCTYCLTGQPVTLPPVTSRSVDMGLVRQVLAATDVRDDPAFLARVAFGIKSPRVTMLNLDKHEVFRSMAGHDFKDLLKEFTKVCESTKQSGIERVEKVKANKEPSPGSQTVGRRGSRPHRAVPISMLGQLDLV